MRIIQILEEFNDETAFGWAWNISTANLLGEKRKSIKEGG